jgi:peptide deformylase
MKLIKYNDPFLKNKSESFDFKNPPFDPIEFSKNLVRFMYDNNGICLTAPQVDIPYRIIAMRSAPENLVCFNPRIVMFGDEEVRLDEISLTFPGLEVKIKRPQHCKVRFSLPNGEVKTETYTGMTARVFQHCMDFLDGELFYQKANPIHREQALRKWKRKNEHLLSK